MQKAIVLLSGGIDSCVALSCALSQKRECLALSFDYGQRHSIELESAKKIASHCGTSHTIIRIDDALFANSSSSLLNSKMSALSSTYVPSRNLLFFAHAACFAEANNASEIYFGANSDDYENYPDCRPEFIEAFERAISNGSEHRVKIVTPLIKLTKEQIGSLGRELNSPLDLTWSCYDPQKKNTPCERCLACLLRSKAL